MVTGFLSSLLVSLRFPMGFVGFLAGSACLLQDLRDQCFRRLPAFAVVGAEQKQLLLSVSLCVLCGVCGVCGVYACLCFRQRCVSSGGQMRPRGGTKMAGFRACGRAGCSVVHKGTCMPRYLVAPWSRVHRGPRSTREPDTPDSGLYADPGCTLFPGTPGTQEHRRPGSPRTP